jgi:hypothetical protein
MSRTTVAAAKAELYALLWSANAPTFSATGVDTSSIHVYDHEPKQMTHPFSVTIATAGFTPDDWVLAVRIYADTARADAKTAQDQLDLLIPAVDVKIGSNGGFGPSSWEIDWDADLDALIATNLLNVGRQDYF